MKKRVPKKIAGVRIPKTLRKAEFLKLLLGSELGRRMLADALVAAAGAAAAVLVQNNSDEIAAAGKSARRKTARTGSLMQGVIQSAAAAATEVIGEAAKTMLKGDPGKPSGKRKSEQNALSRQRH
jgi:hypothetical protein